MRTVKVLSIMQPWVWLILAGLKPVENRTWATRHRGELFLHASKTYDEGAHIALRQIGIIVPRRETLEYGGIVGRATLVDCVTEHPSPYFSGPYGFVLSDVEKLPFVPVRGMPGLFEVRL